MKIEQIYTGCLAEAAYYIESKGEVAIIDPLRETSPYIQRAEKNGAYIKYVLETHFHADFVSGHVDLAKKTGATIVYGPNAAAGYDIHAAEDGEILHLGDITITVLHTPGHTMESTTYLLKDENGKDYAIFTGDTLFIGDVGRPDLAVKTHLTREDLAGHLYDSLRNKIMPLADDVIVYPAHGAGSACGKNLSSETSSTLGHQKQFNYALRVDMTRDEFVKEVTDGLAPPPQYFPKNAMINKNGYESIDTIIERGTLALDPQAFEDAAEATEALILDTRNAAQFVKAHIPGSIFIGIDGGFAPWVGALITDIDQPILIVTDPGREEEVVTRLARVGYDHTLGYLNGGIESWIKAEKETDQIESISSEKFAEIYAAEPILISDVRKCSEYDNGHVVNALNLPLDFIAENTNKYDKDEKYYVHCAGGYRSVIAASILKARGYHNLVNVEGGYAAIKNTPIPTEISESVAS
jgi:glyoxylase-like metal-dependent hydrolase (beta-lactamase superfamily II)/rhodanese-related sulfurtransferase